MQNGKTGEQKDVVWIKPALTCRVRFAGWTDQMTPRSQALLGFSGRAAAEAAGEEFIL